MQVIYFSVLLPVKELLNRQIHYLHILNIKFRQLMSRWRMQVVQDLKVGQLFNDVEVLVIFSEIYLH